MIHIHVQLLSENLYYYLLFFSLKKLKSKDEHKLRRKQHKVSFQDKEDKQILQQQQDSAAPSQQKGASCSFC